MATRGIDEAYEGQVHAGKTFRAYSGIGPQDPGCVGGAAHDWPSYPSPLIRTIGRCLTASECRVCGVTKIVDSSD